ncbi:S1C family serine protease [Saliterribacillus persicus]|nr:S1C family serine protease [Saliterribacillus persicus]
MTENNHQDFNNENNSLEGEEINTPQEQNEVEATSTNTTEENEKKEPKKNKTGWQMFVSGIAGGLVVAVTGGTLLATGAFDDTLSEAEPNEETAEVASSNIAESDVTPVINEDSSSLSPAINQVSDAVVGVSNIQQTSLWEESDPAGAGSGVVYKKEGDYAYVVTNNHVVDGAKDLEVVLTDGESVPAELLGGDQLTDLAVLRIDAEHVEKVAPLGESSSITVGDTAIAIGNPLGNEFAGSVTKGIISGLERSVEMDLNRDGQPDWTTEVIQTDAAINPGNSGGALINTSGEVIGINSMKIATATVEGIGFAIPIDDAKPIIDQLETEGEVTRPFIGISAVDLSTVPAQNKQQDLELDDSVEDGVVVAEIQADSPADEAGLERYDVITKINDQAITSMMDVKNYLYKETNTGDEVRITFYRNGKLQTTDLTLVEQPVE